MPIFTALFSGIGAIISGIGSFLGGLGFIGRALISIGLNIAQSFLMRLLTGGQKEGQRGVQYETSYGENQARLVLCGLRATKGHRIHDHAFGSGNKYLQHVYQLSDFPITEVTRIWFNGELVSLGADNPVRGKIVTSGEWSGRIWVKILDGRQTQADGGLVADGGSAWSTDAVGAGIAYAIITMEYDQKKLTQPVDPFFEIKGAPLYDWRKDSTVGGSGAHRWNDVTTWEYSENPILMAYAYARGISWAGDIFCGMAMPSADLPLAKWTAAANLCDEIADGALRYRCSIELDCMAEHKANFDALMLTCGGMIVTGVSGLWPIVGSDQPIVATITDDDRLPATDMDFSLRRRTDTLINSVSGTFPDPANIWSPRPYKRATDAALVTIDRRTRDVPINFDHVPYAGQAAQLASIYLSENRYQAVARAIFKPRWQVLEPGDWINWQTDKYGTLTFMVTDMTVQSLEAGDPRSVSLSLQQRAGGIYTSVGVVAPPPVIADPVLPVRQQELTDFAVIASTIVGSGGAVGIAIRASWSPPIDADIKSIILEWRVKADPSQVFSRIVTADVTLAMLAEGIVGDTVYEVRHRLETDPARDIAPSAWLEVTTLPAPAADVSVGLAQVRDDVAMTLADAIAEIDRLRARMEATGGNAAIDAVDQYLSRRTVEKRVAAAFARIIEEANLRVSADEALAQQITAVEASVGEGLAGGLIAIRANASPSGGAAAQIDFIVRAGENGVETATAISLRAFSNGDSDILMQAGRLVVTDGTSEALPLVFENGELRLDVARIKAAYVDELNLLGDKGRFGTLAPGVVGLEIST